MGALSAFLFIVGAFSVVKGKTRRTSAEGAAKLNLFVIVGIVILTVSVVLCFISLTLGIIAKIRRRRFERDNQGNDDDEENDEVKDWRPSPGSMVCSTPPPSYAFIIQTDRQGAQDESTVAVPSSFVLSMPSGSHAPAMIVANVTSLIADDDALQPPPTYAEAARLIKQLESSKTVAGTSPVTSDVNA